MPQAPHFKTNIKEFVALIDSKKVTGGQVVVTAARDYPVSFLQYLAQYISKQVGLPLSILAGNSCSDIVSALSMSFLGSAYLYVIPDISIFSAQDRKFLELFFSSYSGDHLIIVGSSQAWSFELASFIVALEERLEWDRFGFFLERFLGRQAKQCFCDYFPKKPVRLVDFGVIAQFCLSAAGISSSVLAPYVARVITPEVSLFSLAEYWLSRDVKRFGMLWGTMRRMYPVEYWTSFYSDLLWQSLYVVSHKGVGLERQMNNRLPFSFSKSSWRTHAARNLVIAHTQIYLLDWEYKNGGSALERLEYILFRFLITA